MLEGDAGACIGAGIWEPHGAARELSRRYAMAAAK